MQAAAPLAFVDLETTGANPEVDRITEIGIVTVTANGAVEEWSQLVNPDTPISPFIEQLTGISNSMVADAPAFASLADAVQQKLSGCLFIAHNARFDYGFLKAEFQRLGLRFRAPTLCTVKLSRKLFPEHHKHNLDALMSRHGLQAESRHRALSDARLIHQFWQIIHKDPGAEAVATAMAAQLSNPNLPPHLDPGAIEDLPEGPGIYLFYGENDQALYVGRAKNIHKQVMGHFSSPKDARLTQEIRRLDWQETTGDIGALLLETHLIKQLKPLHNRRPKKNAELNTWVLDDCGEGWLKPRLVTTDELDFSLQQPCYGIFKNTREALEVLRSLASEHRLCHTLLGLERTPPGKACTGHQLKHCKGACVGKESPAQHSIRLIAGLTRLKLQPWPYPGPALLQEGPVAHVLDAWRYLGSARDEAEIQEYLAGERPPFDRDIYRILVKAAGKLNPLTRSTRAEDCESAPH